MDSGGKRGNLLALIVGGLALCGTLLVVVGRLGEAAPDSGWQDPFYSVLLAFTLDGSFLGRQSLLTLIGALAAALATYLVVIGGALALFERHIAAWRARHMRDHVVVVGEGAEAEELARALAATAPALLVATAAAGRGVPAIDLPATTPALRRAANLAAARAVCLVGDEKRNAALATALAQGRGEAVRPAIWARVGERPIADRLALAAPGAARIEVFDDADMMAREALARHPAHAAAERLAATRVHFVVCGFGRLGQAMAEAALFSGIAAGLGKPMVTVLDVDAAAREKLYRAARPGLALAADFAFIPADLVTAALALRSAQPAFDALRARDELARVTGLALCLGDDTDNVRLALALPELRRREGRYVAPTFMRVRDREATGVVVAPAGGDVNQDVIALAPAGRLIATAVLDTDRRDAAARLVHEAYRQAAGAGAPAGVDWSRLDETYRRANRRAADHLPAKLFSLGLIAERDPQAPVTVARRAHAEVIAPLLAGGDAALDALGALEHRRWVADRAIDGWSPGPVRDDDLKQHPLLASPDYAALAAAEQRKDRDQVRTLLGALAVADGAGAMPERRVALAGHRALAPAEEARGAAALAARLAAALADPAHAVTLLSPLAPGADMALCEALAAALAGRVGALRLIVVEAVPYRIVLEVAAAEETADETVRHAFGAAMLRRRTALWALFGRVDVVRVGIAGRTDDAYRRDAGLFEAGLVAANAYLVRRADMLGVLWDGAPARGPGGTADLVRLWRAPEAIDPALDPGPSARRGATHDAASLVVETVRRAPA